MRIQTTVAIRRPPGEVFRWIADPHLATRWQPEVAGYEITRAGPDPTGRDLTGTEFRETLRDGRGSSELRGRITAHEPGSRMVFDLTGTGIHVRAEYVVEPADDGARLSVDNEVHLGGRLSWLLEPLLRGKITERHRTELYRLRDLCEATAAGEP